MVRAEAMLWGLFICHTQLLRSSQVQHSKAQKRLFQRRNVHLLGPLPAASPMFPTDGNFLVSPAREEFNAMGCSPAPSCTHRPRDSPCDREDRRGAARREEEGLEPVAGGAGGQASPHPALERGKALGTGFLVNSAANSKNTLALDRHPVLLGSPPEPSRASVCSLKGQGDGRKVDL